VIDGRRQVWVVRNLWGLAADLVPFPYEVASFSGFDPDIWCGHVNVPTVVSVLERIGAADLAFPIILSASGAMTRPTDSAGQRRRPVR